MAVAIKIKPEIKVQEGLDFILQHISPPLFPRNQAFV
jgi:hypothetical protein